MPRYVLTGAPGSGKTALLRLLECRGHCVVEEAATDVIALGQAFGEPDLWAGPDFVDRIVTLQRARQLAAPAGRSAVFFDRSPVCTLALARFLGRLPSPLLAAELARISSQEIYARPVFFVRNQGFVTRTAARQISFADSLEFEKMHEEAYRELGFELVEVPPAPLAERAELICRAAGLADSDRSVLRWRDR